MVAGSRASTSKCGLVPTQSMKWAKLVSTRFSSASMPPISSAHDSASMASSITSSDGVLMVAPSNNAVSSAPFLWSLNSLGTGQAGVWLFTRSTARGDMISTPWPPSPPSPFWKLKVTTSSLCHGISMAKQADVASQIVRPARSSGIQSPSGTLTPEAVPFQGNTTSFAKFTCDRSGSAP